MAHTTDLNLKGSLGSYNLRLGGGVQTGGTHVGVADAVIGGLIGLAEAEFVVIGSVNNPTLEGLQPITVAKLEGLGGSGFVSRVFIANGTAALTGLSGAGLSNADDANRRPLVCFTQGIATPISNTVCAPFANADMMSHSECSTLIEADVLNSDPLCVTASQANTLNGFICNELIEADITIATICDVTGVTVPSHKLLCTTVTTAQLISDTVCDSSDIASPVSEVTCATQSDANGRDYTDSQVQYPNGEPYIPSNLFKLEAYDVSSDVRLVRKDFANTATTFIMDAVTDDPISYKTEFYTTATFYKLMPFFPPEAQLVIAAKQSQVLYATGDSSPVSVVEYMGNAPLHSRWCATNNVATPIDNVECVAVRQGDLTSRSTCVPYDFLPEVVPPVEPPVEPPVTGETITVPTQEVYTVNNTVQVALENGTPFDLANINISLDSKTHSWAWDAKLLSRSLVNVLTPQANGQAIIIDVTINGESWKLLVEKITTNRRFNNTSVTLSGRGITAQMDAPYLAVTSYENTQLLTNQQIAESFLPAGWTINWQLPVWNVPIKAYSHRNLTPLKALLELVHDCGGMLIPSRNSTAFTVRKRYPVVPWQFSIVDPDVIVPDDVILSLTEEPTTEFGANGVYIHGFNDGKQALVKRNGTDGARLALTRSSALMVDATAIRTLGERALSAADVQPKIRSISTIFEPPTIPLIEIGMLVEFNVDSASDRGIVNSVAIRTSVEDDGVITVEQGVTIGENTENLFSLFAELIPSEPVSIVTIQNIGSNNTSVVTTITGAVLTVNGTGTVGVKYYLKGDTLQGVAPVPTVLNDILV